jgi:hypothetical protein
MRACVCARTHFCTLAQVRRFLLLLGDLFAHQHPAPSSRKKTNAYEHYKWKAPADGVGSWYPQAEVNDTSKDPDNDMMQVLASESVHFSCMGRNLDTLAL